MKIALTFEEGDEADIVNVDGGLIAAYWCEGDTVVITSTHGPDSDGDYLARMACCVTGASHSMSMGPTYLNQRYVVPHKAPTPVPTFNTVEEAEAWLNALSK